MPEQEELTLVVTLDDRASAQLGNLRAQLSSMAQGVSQAGAGMGASTGKAAAGVAQLQGGLMGMVAKGTFIGNVLSGITKEVGKLGEEVVARALDIDKLTQEFLDMSRAAYSLGTSTGQLRQNFQSFREAGIPVGEAQKAMQGLTQTFYDFQSVNNQLVPQLRMGQFLPTDQIRGFIGEMNKAKSLEGMADVVKKLAHETREYNTVKYGAVVGAQKERELLDILRSQGIELVSFKRATEEQIRLDEDRKAGAVAYRTISAETSASYEKVGRSLGFIVQDMLLATGAAGSWNEYMKGVTKYMEDVEQRMRTAKAKADAAAADPGYHWFDPRAMFDPANIAREKAVAPELHKSQFPGATTENLATPGGIPQMQHGGSAFRGRPYIVGERGPEMFVPHSSGSIMAGSGSFGSSLAESEHLDELKKNTEELKRLNDSLMYSQVGGVPGGGLAKQLGIDSIGATPGGGGGFGGGGASGSWGGGAATSGGAATFGGGAGGGAAGGVQGAPGTQSGLTGGAQGGDIAVSGGKVNPTSLYSNLVQRFSGSSLAGYVPPDGAKYGITTGSPQEWARLGVALASQESSFKAVASETGAGGRVIGNAGLFQFSAKDLRARGMSPDISNVGNQVTAMVGEFEKIKSVGSIAQQTGPQTWKGAAEYFGPFRRPQEILKHMKEANAIAAGAGATATGQPAAGTAGVPGTGTPGVPYTGAPVKLMTEGMAPAGARVGAGAPGGTSIITTTSGRNIRVASDYAANFKGFLDDYERAGGLAGPNTGGLAGRPSNPSYHPRGMAIDLNQIGYGIRGGGKTLPQAQEDALAAKWGLFPGSQFSSRSDIGHFEVRNRAAALAAQQRNLQGVQGVQGVQPGAQAATPVTVVGVTPDASRVLAESNQRIANTAASATAAAVKAGATPEVAAAAGAAAAQAAAGGGVMDKPAGIPTGPKPEPETQTEDARLDARLKQLDAEDVAEADKRLTTRQRKARDRARRTDERHTQEGEKLQQDAERRDREELYKKETPLEAVERREREGKDPFSLDPGQRRGPTPDPKKRRVEKLSPAQRRQREREAIWEQQAARQKEADKLKQEAEDAKAYDTADTQLETLRQEEADRRDPAGKILRELGKEPVVREPDRPGRPGKIISGATDSTTGFSSTAGKALDASGRGLDAASDNTVKVQADGTLKVDVRAAKGTSVAAAGSGAFKKTVVDRQTQMEPAESGPNHDPSLDS